MSEIIAFNKGHLIMYVTWVALAINIPAKNGGGNSINSVKFLRLNWDQEELLMKDRFQYTKRK